MKVHDGRCTADRPCTKTHAYKCRLCKTLYKSDVYRDSREQDTHFPFYPYCSQSCASTAIGADPGFKLFVRTVSAALQDSAATTKYPHPSVHEDFNEMMKEVQKL